ncbi:molybdopterin molybdotransferase MoeA [Roseivirga sp. E12]|uniref:molybdopterin molybdotransferase MoeA n=1 Tax=Roseivirga sp. E12 TaxID=2819237 RepID=UPI001ABD1BDD|nr:molybdopterin molybdotransferase MoeA [Roseivirga sp. E12]MBO3697376.1 molybdopterin molybdotransferase MoeA [Roseivirga sp. E12]
MITYHEALDIISKHPFKPKLGYLKLEEIDGHVLNEDLYADRDFPPLDRVTMDGISINYESFSNGQRSFEIEKTIGAGMPQSSLEDPSKCVQIMTGAMLPLNADTVIRYEDISIEDNIATINIETIKHRQNVHFKGEDKKQSDVVLSKGTVLGAPEMIIAASIGKPTLEVRLVPKAAIITTGDELVSIDEIPLDHQIRRSSNYGVQDLLKQWNIEAKQYHLKDNKELMMNELSSIISTVDLLVLTGGVSRGKFDFLPEVLEELGVVKHFHKVKQRPGKPFWFGTAPNGTTVFALPGNPVSTFACANVYIKHWLSTSLGISKQTIYVKLNQDIEFTPPLTYFLECRAEFSNSGELEATPFRGHGSGDFANMSQANGFVILPSDKSEFKKGEVYPYILYRKDF